MGGQFIEATGIEMKFGFFWRSKIGDVVLWQKRRSHDPNHEAAASRLLQRQTINSPLQYTSATFPHKPSPSPE